MTEIERLTEEMENWEFLADGLHQEHQQSARNDLLRKVETLKEQINELSKAEKG